MMRRKLFITICALCLTATAALARQNLSIERALNGRYRNADYAIETIVTGKQVKQYDLSLYHSLTVTDPAAIADLRRLVAADSRLAVNKEVRLHNGEINYGFYQFEPLTDKQNRFIFFYSNDSKAVLIYMEGKTSIDNIKSLIKK